MKAKESGNKINFWPIINILKYGNWFGAAAKMLRLKKKYT
jgi:hypothetical protein